MGILGGFTFPASPDDYDDSGLFLLPGAILLALAGALCGGSSLRSARHYHLPGGNDTVYALAGGQPL